MTLVCRYEQTSIASSSPLSRKPPNNSSAMDTNIAKRKSIELSVELNWTWMKKKIVHNKTCLVSEWVVEWVYKTQKQVWVVRFVGLYIEPPSLCVIALLHSICRVSLCWASDMCGSESFYFVDAFSIYNAIVVYDW